jgi:hypothetical protein
MNADYERRCVGVLLTLSGLMTVFIMFHHPTHLDSGSLNAWVHGGMIGVILASTFGVTYLGAFFSPRRPVLLAACLLFALGSVLNILAATINGFVVPELLSRFGAELSTDLRAAAWSMNQNLARIAVVTHSAAMVLIGTQLLSGRTRRIEILMAVVGVVAGVLSLGVLVVHRGQMDVLTAFIVYAFEAVWIAMTGWLLLSWKGTGFKQPGSFSGTIESTVPQ